MPRILQNVSPRVTHCKEPSLRYACELLMNHIDMTSTMVRNLFDALLHGLYDYSMDERGDVGSWIRIACIEGLASFSEILLSHADDIPNFEEYLPSNRFHDTVGGILKQGVERLDSVRQEAGKTFHRLLQLPQPDIVSRNFYRIHGCSLMQELFLTFVPTASTTQSYSQSRYK
jgi:tubulin-specific chaperone D